MDLLKYLEPMKNLPKRFSNLAFWRDVRKFKNEVVNAFEYVDSWGTHIESLLPSGEYVPSKSVTLTPNVEFYPSDLSTRIFTLASDSDGSNVILPILSVVGSLFRINLTTEKTSVIKGKHIDAIRVTYLTSEKIKICFEMPTTSYQNIWFGGTVNGCAISQCSVFGRVMSISVSEMPKYENMTLESVVVLYH